MSFSQTEKNSHSTELWICVSYIITFQQRWKGHKFFENSIQKTCSVMESSTFGKNTNIYMYKMGLSFQYEIAASDYMHYSSVNSHHHLILKVNVAVGSCTNFQKVVGYSDDLLMLNIVYYTYFDLFKLIKLIQILKYYNFKYYWSDVLTSTPRTRMVYRTARDSLQKCRCFNPWPSIKQPHQLPTPSGRGLVTFACNQIKICLIFLNYASNLHI